MSSLWVYDWDTCTDMKVYKISLANRLSPRQRAEKTGSATRQMFLARHAQHFNSPNAAERRPPRTPSSMPLLLILCLIYC